MKIQVLIILLGLCCVSAKAQNCDKIVQKIEVAYRTGRNAEALTQIRALRACDVSEQGKKLADAWTEKVYKSVQAQKDLAESSLTKANRLIRYFNFDDEKAAWAYKDGLFAVIDLNGNTLTDFMYENSEPFNNGVAIAGINNQYVFVNDRGEEVSERYDCVIAANRNRYFARKTYYKIVLDSLGQELYNTRFFTYDINDGLSLIFQDSLMGIEDSTGHIIIQPLYQYIGSFSEGIAQAKKDEKWGAINMKGQVIVPFQFEQIEDFMNERARVKLNNKWGFVNNQGEIIIPMQYDQLWDFSEGLARFEQEGLWGFIDEYGQVVMAPKYEDVGDFSQGLARFQMEGKWGYLNAQGFIQIPPKYDLAEDFECGTAKVYKEGKSTFIDKNGQFQVLREWSLFSDYSARINKVEEDGKYGLVDKNGIVVLAPDYQFEFPYWYYTKVEKDGKWGFFNYNGQMVIYPIYEDAGDFSAEGFMPVKLNGQWGIIDTAGKVIVPLKYDSIAYHSFLPIEAWKGSTRFLIDQEGQISMQVDKNVFNEITQLEAPDTLGVYDPQLTASAFDVNHFEKWVTKEEQNGLWGLIDMTGHWVVKPQFEEVKEYSKGLWNVGIRGKYGIIDDHGYFVVPPRYSYIWGLITGLAEVATDQGRGFLDITGKQVLPCQYRKLHRCGYRMYLLEQNGRYGLFAPDYGVRIEPAYEELGFVDEEFGWIRARKNGKWGWVDKTGEVKIHFRFDAAAPFKDGKARVLQLPYEETFYINEKGEMILGE